MTFKTPFLSAPRQVRDLVYVNFIIIAHPHQGIQGLLPLRPLVPLCRTNSQVRDEVLEQTAARWAVGRLTQPLMEKFFNITLAGALLRDFKFICTYVDHRFLATPCDKSRLERFYDALVAIEWDGSPADDDKKEKAISLLEIDRKGDVSFTKKNSYVYNIEGDDWTLKIMNGSPRSSRLDDGDVVFKGQLGRLGMLRRSNRREEGF